MNEWMNNKIRILEYLEIFGIENFLEIVLFDLLFYRWENRMKLF